ncbi:hypothetical protein JCM16303_003005 [Sporobolomyces ruberrimus]
MVARLAAQTFLRSALPVRRATPSILRFSTSSISRAEPTPAPASSTPPPPTLSPKISSIVDEISKLTLLEAADLVDALKTRLNIVDIALPAASAAPAASAPSGDAAAAEPEKPKEKTVFNVNLTKIDAAQKAKAIREVKALMTGMNLVEAKKFVESLPKTLKEGATKEEAEKLQTLFKAIGAEVSLD